jgi:hypothetical protein
MREARNIATLNNSGVQSDTQIPATGRWLIIHFVLYLLYEFAIPGSKILLRNVSYVKHRGYMGSVY